MKATGPVRAQQPFPGMGHGRSSSRCMAVHPPCPREEKGVRNERLQRAVFSPSSHLCLKGIQTRRLLIVEKLYE